MSKFIELGDYDASIHRDILDSVTREDKAIVEICGDRAIEQMRSYMSGRYDCDAIFSASGKERVQLVVMFCADISVYHLFCIHNPQKLSPMRKDRYDRALEWLRRVQKGDVNIEGAPLREERTADSPYQILSNRKRTVHR